MTTTATPQKLRDGSWGARAQGAVKPGDEVTITTRSGKSWTARVARVLWTDGRASIVATEQRPARGTDSYGHSIGSGASCRAGVTAPHGRVCPMCGSRECPRAWNPHDLCQDD